MESIKKSLTLVAAITVVGLVPGPAHAITYLGFGAEAEEICAAIAALQSAVTALQQAGNGILSSIQNVEQAMAQALGDEQFTTLVQGLRQDRARLDGVYAELTRIGQTEASIRAQFQRAFPQDARAWTNVRYSDYDGLLTMWHSQTMAASAAATQVLTSLADIRDRDDRARDILSLSQANHSEIQQLQTHGQMLAVMQSDLSAILQSLASQGQVVAQMAAQSASEKAAVRELGRRRVEHYDDPHRSPFVYSRMPPIQQP